MTDQQQAGRGELDKTIGMVIIACTVGGFFSLAVVALVLGLTGAGFG